MNGMFRGKIRHFANRCKLRRKTNEIQINKDNLEESLKIKLEKLLLESKRNNSQ